MINEPNEQGQEDWASVVLQLRIMRHFLEMPNSNHASRIEKRFGLKGCGLSDAEVDRLCEPKPLNTELIMKSVQEHCAAERRALNRIYRQSQKSKPRRPPKLKAGRDANICYLD
jgi:diketogulonate reductase-like aldo/keto reductase